MNRAAPWWLTWLLSAGIVVFLVGERVLATSPTTRTAVLGLAGAIVLACVAWRVASWRSAAGEARSVEGILVLAYLGCALALAVHVASTVHGIDWLGLSFDDDESRSRYRTSLQVAWAILLTVSILPALTAQVSIGAYRHTGLAAGLEALRVRETASGGLTVALACSLLFLVCYITAERDQTLDLSYFKTSEPGSASSAIVASFDEPLQVDLFFPEVSEVKEEALRYFRELAREADDRVQIREYDRLSVPKIAEEFQVVNDGTIILRKGDRTQRLEIGDSMDVSRIGLRKLDADVQTVLMLLLRERRAAYVTKGHGELNDTLSASVRTSSELRGVQMISRILSGNNYDRKDLGLQEGLGRDVPQDAAMVAVLGPQTPFLDEELASLDPGTRFELGPLARWLGVKFDGVELANEEQHLRQRDVPSDRRLIVTDRFGSHRAVPTVQGATGNAVMFAGAGYLETGDTTLSHVSYLVRSLSSTFPDLDGDYEFDEGKEVKNEYNVVAVVEGKFKPAAPQSPDSLPAGTQPVAPSAAEVDTTGMRALVVADAEAFSDPVLNSLGLNAAMVNDAVKWLGHEEGLAGTTGSELDIPIQHTQSEDVVWFYSIILGAPVLVLGFGLGGVFRRQKRRGGQS